MSTQDSDLRPFAAFLEDHNRGRTHRELSVALRDLVAAVVETGKPGSLTLSISIRPQPGADGIVMVTDKVTTRAPSHDRAASIFYVDDDHNLSRSDPHQPGIFEMEH